MYVYIHTHILSTSDSICTWDTHIWYRIYSVYVDVYKHMYILIYTVYPIPNIHWIPAHKCIYVCIQYTIYIYISIYVNMYIHKHIFDCMYIHVLHIQYTMYASQIRVLYVHAYLTYLIHACCAAIGAQCVR